MLGINLGPFYVATVNDGHGVHFRCKSGSGTGSVGIAVTPKTGEKCGSR